MQPCHASMSVVVKVDVVAVTILNPPDLTARTE